MKIFVAGSTGLIGSAFLRLVPGADGGDQQQGNRLRWDFRRREDCEAIFCLGDWDAVVHCAARIGGIAEQRADPAMPVTDNLVMTARLLEVAAKAKRQPKFLLLSSSTVYPGYGHPVDEVTPLLPDSLYQGVGGMKVYCEQLARFYYDKFGLEVYILRLSAVYGPGDRSRHVIPDLVRRALRLGDGEVLRVWGSPGTVRDLVYVDDVVRASVLALTRAKPCDPINVGSGVGVTMQQLADVVWGEVKGRPAKEGGIVFGTDGPEAIPYRVLVTDKARGLLGWHPEVGLAEGISKVAAWERGRP